MKHNFLAVRPSRAFCGGCVRMLGVLLAAALLLSLAQANAQTITGAIRGSVTDPSGAAVPKASVTASNTATGVNVSTTSDATGLYNFQFLPIGSYTITATAPSFQTSSVGPLRLEIDQIAQVNVKLQVGSVSTTVSVAADASAVLQTQSATTGTTVTSNTIENLPLSGLNFQVAGVFVPGAVLPRFDLEGGQNGYERDTTAATAPSFNGNRQQGNNYILDGVEINETTNNTVGYNPAPEAIQEMRTITANADAEYGDVNGGEFVLVTKGGTNQFHGSAYEYYENQYLTANLWSNNNHPTPIPKSVFHQSQFGATIGGPVMRNKLFFFADFLGARNISAGTGTATVATAKMRTCTPNGGGTTCDFSDLLNTPGYAPVQLYNPAISTTNPTGGYTNASKYPNNQIPLNNPVWAYLIAHPEIYPAPNRTPDANTPDRNNYGAPTLFVARNNQGDARVDWTLGAKDSLLFRYSDGDAYDINPKGRPSRYLPGWQRIPVPQRRSELGALVFSVARKSRPGGNIADPVVQPGPDRPNGKVWAERQPDGRHSRQAGIPRLQPDQPLQLRDKFWESRRSSGLFGQRL